MPAGDVISQNPDACTDCVAPGSAVDIVVSLGPGGGGGDDGDGDSVADNVDFCPNTAIPEGVPTENLNANHWALIDADFEFDTVLKGKGKGPNRRYNIADTAGCSCEQIIEAQGLGAGHTKFGCSISAMDDWISSVNQ